MHRLTTVIRVLYGLLFLVAGLNYFFHFFMIPAGVKGNAFLLALEATGYMQPLNAGVQAVAGVMLVLNIFTPLALLLLAPIVVNILLFHIFLAPEMLWLAIVVTVVECFLALIYWDNFSHLFKRNKS